MRKRILASAIATACAGAWLMVGAHRPVAAQNGADPNAGLDPAEFGMVSPLIPMQSTEAVHMGLVWKENSNEPRVLYHARFPDYRGIDVADPVLTDLAIEKEAFKTAGLQFNSSLRDVLHGFDPFLGLGTDRSADDSFQRLTYGGYLMRQGLSQSVPTRIVANRQMERQLLFDPFHPDAFRNTGKFHTALLDETDFALNRAAFQENGYSKGMFYNTYCNARVTLADGRVYVFGGHDMQSNNGLYKVNVFDPETEEWVRRAEPCTRSNWTDDPFGDALFSSDPNAQNYPGCDQRNQQSTQPSDPSDQKYARWYPSAAPLPNGWVLVLGGFDQDGIVPPDPGRAAQGRENTSQSDTAFTASRVNIVVPEVYDPVTDRNIALENARMAFPLYPQMEVVQTGPRNEDWMVCTYNGERNYGAIENEVPPGSTTGYRNALGEVQQGGARFGVGGGTPPFRDGNTWCLDVIGALKDPKRDVPAKNHWKFLDRGSELRPYCCSTASFVEIDESGLTKSHKWFMIGGQNASGPTGTVEVMDFTDGNPRWRNVGTMLQPLATTKAVLLPDGNVLVGQGVNRTVTCAAGDTRCFDEKEGHFFQMFDPRDVDRGTGTISVKQLALTTVSRGLHGTATLLPDGTALFAGENREALVRPDDPRFPMTTSYAGELPFGDPDQGVPVGQIFSPPYLFVKNSNGARATRPTILKSPSEISYRGSFDVEVDRAFGDIGSVVLLRSDHNTHSLTAGDRYVKLAFGIKGDPRAGGLRVVSPTLPAQAVPGVYILFVVDKQGVPSEGRQVRLKPETRGTTTPFR
jgi:hypothetical protein